MTLNAKLVHRFLWLSAPVSLGVEETNATVHNLFHKPETNKLYTDPCPQNKEVIKRLYFLQGNII